VIMTTACLIQAGAGIGTRLLAALAAQYLRTGSAPAAAERDLIAGLARRRIAESV
jgi:hypothetical protein